MKNKLKVLIAILLIALMMLSIVACGNTSTGKNNTNNSNPTNSATDNPSADIPSADNNDDNKEIKLNKFEQFEQGLTGKNIVFEVNEKLASMVGAKEGYGYVFEDETAVELYLFDKSTDAYKEAFNTQKLTLESFGITMDVEFNEDICIYYNGESSNQADIEAIFKSLK